jgi:hypothetical protein
MNLHVIHAFLLLILQLTKVAFCLTILHVIHAFSLTVLHVIHAFLPLILQLTKVAFCLTILHVIHAFSLTVLQLTKVLPNNLHVIHIFTSDCNLLKCEMNTYRC